MQAVQELEAKFLVASGKRPKRVLRRVIQELSWAGYQIRPLGDVQVQDRYLDTKSWCLHRAGWTYRQRDADGKKTLTLKQLGGGRGALFERCEIEQEAKSSDVNHPKPGPVAVQLDELLGSHRAAFDELFVLDNKRTRYRLTHPNYPEDVIELCLDRVRIKAEYDLSFAELEFELRQGHSEFLVDLLSILHQQPDLVPARLGKYQRGLFAAACEPQQPGRKKPAANADSRWQDVGRRFLVLQLELLKAYEPFAFEAIHAESVHEMRVVTRRIRAALDLFAPVLPKKDLKKLNRRVRNLSRSLGGVRDIDVHLERLQGYRDKLSADGRSALDVYQRHLQRDRRKAHTGLIKHLEGAAYSSLLSDYDSLLDQRLHPLRSKRLLRVRDAGRAFVKPQLKKVLKEGASITSKSSDETLHHLRIEVKRLRYQIEHLHMPGKSIKRAGKTLTKLQGTLGGHQDAILAREHLRRHRKKSRLRRAESQVFKKLIRLEDEVANNWRECFSKDWQAFEVSAKRLKKAFG